MLKAGNRLKEIPLPPFELDKDKKVVIYGTGDVAERYYKKIVQNYDENKVAFFIDGQLVRDTFLTKKVFLPETITEKENYQYIIGSFGSSTLMKKRLQNNGIKEKDILPTMDRCNIEYLYNMQTELRKVLIYPTIVDAKEKETIKEAILEYAIPNEKFNGIIEMMSNETKEVAKGFRWINAEAEIVDINEYDLILVWRPSALYDEQLEGCKHVYCFHPDVIPHLETKILNCVSMHLLNNYEKREYSNSSIQNFRILRKELSMFDRAYVFGSGPSITDFVASLEENKLNDGIRIVCNEFCENKTVMEVLAPQLYVLWDYGFFEKKLEGTLLKLCDYIKNHNCRLVIPNTAIRIFHEKHNLELEKIIGINPYGKERNFPTENALEILRTDNVMTAFLLPIASTLTNTIFIAGCDGMKENEGWKHSDKLEGKSIQYSDNVVEQMGTDLLNAKYKGYCKAYEQFFEYGETVGKKYYTLTKSYIPAMQERYCKKL